MLSPSRHLKLRYTVFIARRFAMQLLEVELYAVGEVLRACKVMVGETYPMTALEAFDTHRRVVRLKWWLCVSSSCASVPSLATNGRTTLGSM